MSDFAPGGLVGERYELGRQLGAGGMARVYLAYDRLLDREVALKVLAERYASDPAFVERFRREASAAAGLNHPNIVSIYDRGETDGSYYIVMEYLDGPDLKAVIRRRGPLPAEEAVDNALQILAALGAAHRRDIVHRDIKPQNVMVAEDGRLKVTDFGIARAGSQSAMTEAGAVIGTAQYLSPEQAKGEEVTAASDCYSLGIVLYEMLTGRLPFEAERAVAVAMKQINEPPVPPQIYEPSIPDSLNGIVLRALEKRPANRFRTTEEFSRALQEVRRELGGETGTMVLGAVPPGGTAQTRKLDGDPPTGATRRQAPPPATPPPTVRRARPAPPPPPPRRRAWPWVVGVLALLLVAGAALAFVLAGRDDGGNGNRNGNGNGGTTEATAPALVAIPSVEGRSPTGARQLLESRGFMVELRSVADESAESTVLRTQPPAREMVERGSRVELLVSSGPETTTVPDVVNIPVDDARLELTGAGFEVAIVEDFSDEIAEGRVISQDPGGGTEAGAGIAVTLTVSLGVQQVTVPDVRRVSLRTATTRLQDEGLEVGGTSEIPNDEFAPGTVVDQDPGPSSQVDSGTAVNLVVAAAVPQRPVPGVIGDPAETARAKLEMLGYTVTASEGPPPAGEPEGIVIGQTPAPDTLAEPGVTVSIIVSSGPPVEPPAPTPTAPPQPTSPTIPTVPTVP